MDSHMTVCGKQTKSATCLCCTVWSDLRERILRPSRRARSEAGRLGCMLLKNSGFMSVNHPRFALLEVVHLHLVGELCRSAACVETSLELLVHIIMAKIVRPVFFKWQRNHYQKSFGPIFRHLNKMKIAYYPFSPRIQACQCATLLCLWPFL